MADLDASDEALLVGMPLRHLQEARTVCETLGRVILPAGSPGDLDRATPGVAVFLMASDAGDDAVPAATWGATFAGRILPADAGASPELLPAGWLAERRDREPLAPAAVPVSRFGDDDEPDENPDADDDDQSYFAVTDLGPLPKEAWVFTNEVVRKQERGGRAYLPRSPRLIRPPD